MHRCKEILNNQKGQTFLEVALYTILFTFVVAVGLTGLSGAVGDKITAMKDRVSQIGTP